MEHVIYRAQIISNLLDHVFPQAQIPLDHQDAYTLLIAVLLSARNQDVRVNRITPRLFSLASTPEGMMQLSIDEIQAVIRPCGLSFQKATAIWNLSRILVERHHSMVPCSFAELEALPGIGHKSASVVMAQWFKVPAFPVDTHIHRLALRWKLSQRKTAQAVESDLKLLFAEEHWIKRHLQMISYAKQYCPARGIHDQCVICLALFSLDS